MKKTTILLVEDQKKIWEALERAFSKDEFFFLIGRTNNESDAEDFLQKFQPAVVMISLPLLLGRCNRLAQAIAAMPRQVRPLLLVTTTAASFPDLGGLHVTGLPHLFCQDAQGNYCVDEIMDCLRSIREDSGAFSVYPAKRRYQKEIDKQERLADFAAELSAMGITCRLLGHMYLIEGVSQTMEALPGVPDVTRLYRQIADVFHTRPCNIERAIRTAIKSAWSEPDHGQLSQHYTQAVSTRSGAPTNKDFIVYFARKYA